MLFSLRCVTFPPIWQQSAQDVGCTTLWFFLLWVVAALSNIFPSNKVGVGVPGVCSTKERFFFLALPPHYFFGGLSAFCCHYHTCGTGVCSCPSAGAGDKTCGFWHLGMLRLAVAAGGAFLRAAVAALSSVWASVVLQALSIKMAQSGIQSHAKAILSGRGSSAFFLDYSKCRVLLAFPCFCLQMSGEVAGERQTSSGEMGMRNLHWKMLFVSFFLAQNMMFVFWIPFLQRLSLEREGTSLLLPLVCLPLLQERTVSGSKASPHLSLPGTCLCLMPPLLYFQKSRLSWAPELPIAMENGSRLLKAVSQLGCPKPLMGTGEETGKNWGW